MKKIILVSCFVLILVFLNGCGKDYGDFRCGINKDFDKRTYVGFKDWQDCHDYLSEYCNMNISKTFCKEYE